MRNASFKRAGWAAGILAGMLSPAAIQAQTAACDAASLKGAYGYRLSGFVYDQQGYTYYLGAVGRLTGDGAGAITGSQTFSFDGTILKQQLTGTYTVNADCTGSLTLTSEKTGSMHFDFVIVNSGQEIELVQADEAFVLTGTMKRQTSAPSPTAQP